MKRAETGMGNHICAIVVTYNRKEMLRECISALLDQSLAVDILVVDNASSDGTEEMLREWIEERAIRYYNTGKNLGGAGGFHHGIKRAMSYRYDYLWLMDDDTIADREAAILLYQAARRLDDHFGFLCSTVYFDEYELCAMNRPGISAQWYKLERFRHINEGMINVKNATFVSFFVRAKVVKRVGLPLKEFFIWYDDMEYSLRINKIYDNYLVYDSKVQHKMEQNRHSDIVTDSYERIGRYYYDYRNRFYVARHDGAEELAKYFFFMFRDIVGLMTSKCDHRLKRLGILWKGFVSGWFFYPRIEYVRGKK